MDESLITSTYSPLTFAFLGDAVYSLYIREGIVRKGNVQPNKLHKRTSDIVKAESQAKSADAIQGLLSEAETDIYRRGHNAHTESHAKNASLSDYHKATGLEALFGWLYLKGDTERIEELIRACLEALSKE